MAFSSSAVAQSAQSAGTASASGAACTGPASIEAGSTVAAVATGNSEGSTDGEAVAAAEMGTIGALCTGVVAATAVAPALVTGMADAAVGADAARVWAGGGVASVGAASVGAMGVAAIGAAVAAFAAFDVATAGNDIFVDADRATGMGAGGASLMVIDGPCGTTAAAGWARGVAAGAAAGAT